MSSTISYRDSLPHFPTAGGGPYLRGWMNGELESTDVHRGRPCFYMLLRGSTGSTFAALREGKNEAMEAIAVE